MSNNLLSSLPPQVSDLLHSVPAPRSANSQLAVYGASALAALSAIWIARDKAAWEAFGTGGTPPSWWGWARNNILLRTWALLTFTRLDDAAPLRRLVAPGGPAADSPTFLPSSGDAAAPIPVRTGPRPAPTRWTLPQRQVPDAPRLAGSVKERLHDLVHRAAAAASPSGALEARRSITEGGSTTALFVVAPSEGGAARPHPGAVDPLLHGEIAHVHPADDSLHVWLSERDAAEVVAKGWGERFTLGPMGMVHQGFVFVYAPRDEAELKVVEAIVKAAVEYVAGVKLDL